MSFFISAIFLFFILFSFLPSSIMKLKKGRKQEALNQFYAIIKQSMSRNSLLYKQAQDRIYSVKHEMK